MGHNLQKNIPKSTKRVVLVPFLFENRRWKSVKATVRRFGNMQKYIPKIPKIR
jgi:hypothetical protein